MVTGALLIISAAVKFFPKLIEDKARVRSLVPNVFLWEETLYIDTAAVLNKSCLKVQSFSWSVVGGGMRQMKQYKTEVILLGWDDRIREEWSESTLNYLNSANSQEWLFFEESRGVDKKRSSLQWQKFEADFSYSGLIT